MGDSKKKDLRLIAATSVTIFSLLTTFVGVFAWFTANRKVNNGAEQFQAVAIHSMVRKISIFNQKENTPYTFQSTAAAIYEQDNDGDYVLTSGDASAIDIPTYSSFSATPDNTLLYLFELDTTMKGSSEDSLYLNAKTETPDSAAAGANGTNGSLVYRNDSDHKVAHPLVFDVTPEEKTAMMNANPSLTENNFGKNSMSSVISFQSKTYATDSDLVASGGYYDLHADFTGESSSFVNKSGTGEAAVYQYTMADIPLFTRNPQSTENIPKYVAAVCHYNADAIQYIFNLNLGNPAADASLIYYTSDWYFLIH